MNTKTGTAAAGRSATVGTVGGGQVTAGQGVVRGPGGNTTTVGGIKGEDAGALRLGDDFYAGKDGNVYKRQEGGGWDQVTKPQPRDGAARPENFDRSSLDRQRNARDAGNYRSGAARSGGYHGGSRGGTRSGGGRRR